MISGFLLNPTVNRVITDLDNAASMTSIVMRDGVDNLGRITQAYKRSPHDGRERLIEENLTTLIWGFGIRWFKHGFDAAAKALAQRGRGRIQLPAFDMTLLAKGPQQLNKTLIDRYVVDAPDMAHHLKALIENRANLAGAYKAANVAKFGLATMLPIGLIAFGIPTLNQWLTRQKIAEAKALPRLKTTQALPPTFQATGQYQPMRRPVAFQAFLAQPLQAQPIPTVGFSSVPVRFGGVGDTAMNGVYQLLQNERVNTLLVDGTISGGRTLKARNWPERLETMFQEAAIVYFLFFAQAPIQRKVSALLDRGLGTHSGLGFNTLKPLLEQTNVSPESLKASLKALTQRWGKQLVLSPQAFEEALVPMARAYAASGKTDDLLLELAKVTEALPVRKRTTGGHTIDLTRKINAEAIQTLGNQLSLLAQRPTEHLKGLLHKSMNVRFAAFVASAGVCTAFLGWMIPWAKQQITPLLTGENTFPGEMNNGERQALMPGFKGRIEAPVFGGGTPTHFKGWSP